MSDVLGIALSGINAAQLQLTTTGNNISNASTPGYSRQNVVLQSNIPQYTGSGFIGNGVQVQTVQRAYNDFLTVQLRQTQSESNQLSTYYTQVQQLDNMMGDSSSGLSPALQNFFTGVQTVANDPSTVSSRQSMISNSQSLVSTFQYLAQQMTQMGQSVNTQISASVTSINSYAQQIAQLNDSITVAQQQANGNPPNDLLDQRDQLLQQLNQQVQATVVKQTDGSYSVFIGSGLPLVVGDKTYALSSITSPTDPTSTEVAYSQAGTPAQLPESSIIGGNLGGLMQFRANSLEPAENSLGRIAIGLATTMNNQNALGQDLNGNPGGNLFTVPAPVVGPSTNNTGNGLITGTISNANALTTSDYSLSYNGTNYQLTRLSDNNVTTFSSFPQTVDGVTLNLASGTVAAGDTYLIKPTNNGASQMSMATSDPNAIAAAAPILASSGVANTGNSTITPGVVNGPPPVNTNLTQPVTITFTAAGTYSVSGTGTGNPTGLSYTPGGNITYNGWTVQISGAPAAGDTFTIAPNSNGSGDSRNALLLAGLQTQNTMANGTDTYQDAYGQMASDIGNMTDQMQVTSTAQQTLLTQTQTSQQSISGVNLDEEAANLIRFQQAYQACGKMIQIASTCFDSIINITP
jgi:flagellar hook-associated protein 1